MEFSLKHTSTLKLPSTIWNFNSEEESLSLEKRMIKFMIDNRGIGLAANQIGIDKRIFILGSESLNNFPKPMALFNPFIIESSKNLVQDQEGCLSFPGLWLKIKRPEWIIGGYYTSAGVYLEQKFEGYAAKCFQHELDHLDGICFIDKISKLKLNLALRKQRKNR
jgi:peptide deformylase